MENEWYVATLPTHANTPYIFACNTDSNSRTSESYNLTYNIIIYQFNTNNMEYTHKKKHKSTSKKYTTHVLMDR